MMKFYFNLQTDDGLAEDPDGCDLGDLEAACDEATRAAREIAAAAVKAGREDAPSDILIADANGRVLAIVSLADMIPDRLRK